MPRLIEPALFGFEADDPILTSPEIYLASVIEKYLQKALEIAETDNNLLLLNYNEGPMPMIERIASFTGLNLSPQEKDVMEERSRYHSKNPEERFSEEPVKNTPSILDSAMESYHALDKKRMATAGV